ncbi:hypothetical protein NOLU111490_11290 [Novosphingobium lubricantis]
MSQPDALDGGRLKDSTVRFGASISIKVTETAVAV